MKKKGLILLLAVCFLFLYTACASAPMSLSDSKESDNGFHENEAPKDPSGGEDYDIDSDTGLVEAQENAKLIKQGTIAVETQDFSSTISYIEALATELGGYLEQSSKWGKAGSQRAEYTVRVPQEQFEPFFQTVEGNSHIVSSNRYIENVSEAYSDIELHLETLRTKHARLIDLLDKAENMENIIALENELSNTQYEIDRLSGQLRSYDRLVDFSTITLTVTETETLSAVSEGTGLGAQLKTAAQNGLNWAASLIKGLLIALVTLWPLLLFAAVVLLVILLLVSRQKKKRKQWAQTPPGENQ